MSSSGPKGRPQTEHVSSPSRSSPGSLSASIASSAAEKPWPNATRASGGSRGGGRGAIAGEHRAALPAGEAHQIAAGGTGGKPLVGVGAPELVSAKRRARGGPSHSAFAH